MDGEAAAPPGIDTSRAHPARVYDYWLGGKDNFAADREAAELALQAYPQLAQAVQANRKFLARAVRYLTGEAGVRQFLDVGTGIPAADNTHQVAQREAPDSRIVYVDNDPIVLLHAQALLKSTRPGACDYIQADLHDPDAILAGAARTLDLSQPVALMLLAILQFIPDEQDPAGLVTRLVAGLPPGSYLVISHPTDDFNPNRSSCTTSASPIPPRSGTRPEPPGSSPAWTWSNRAWSRWPSGARTATTWPRCPPRCGAGWPVRARSGPGPRSFPGGPGRSSPRTWSGRSASSAGSRR